MKPSKWEREDEVTVAREFGPYMVLAWEDELSAGWVIAHTETGKEGTEHFVYDIKTAKSCGMRAARRMVKRMAADLGMVKL